MRYRGLFAVLFALAALSFRLPAFAQENSSDTDENLELTMTLLPEAATLPDAVTKTIELPEPASETGADSSAQGLATANEARDHSDQSDHSDAGLETAAEARERGRDLGQDMAAEAQQNREDQGRGTPPEESPPPPDHPTPPNPPGPPSGP
jgi:hypothetical protein